MSYCLNPGCANPENLVDKDYCQSCGSSLRLRDRYHVLTALGQGGFGATFLAQDQALPGEPLCVIKQLRPSTTSPHIFQMSRELFAREAKTLGKIGIHPQVPRLLDYFEDSQQFYLVQDYVSGLTLQQEVKNSGGFSEAGVKQFLSEILPILQYLHERQVIHRDIKPANIIRRSEDSKLVVIDFGSVKDQISQTITNHSDNTALTAYAVGTPGFAPPEQIAMRPVYASDIYAVGATCIYLLTGKSPKDLDYNSLTGEMIWSERVNVSDRFHQVLKKMLEVSVRHRYQSVQEVLKALELEPYLDSLAKGMAATQKTSPELNNQPDSFPPHSIALQAAAIRARRANLAEATSLYTQVAPKQIQPAQQKPKLGNLDSDTLFKEYTKGRRDFTAHDFSKLDLQRADLRHANFHASNLEKTNLQKANLANTDLGQASLNRANLRDANLSNAYLNHADLEGADLRGADLSHAYLNHVNLRGANLCGANLTNAKVSEEHLSQAKINWMTVRPNGKRGLLI